MRPIEEVYPESGLRTPQPGDPNYIDPAKTRSMQVRGQAPGGNANGYKGSRHVPQPSWEAGKARDHRGVPYLDAQGNKIPIKKFVEERHVPRGPKGMSWHQQIRRNRAS